MDENHHRMTISKLQDIDISNRSLDQIKNDVVIPLLTLLGWSEEDGMDFTNDILQDKKADVALFLKKNDTFPVFVVEVRNHTKKLDGFLSDVLAYAFDKGIPRVLMTDGNDFRAYKLPNSLDSRYETSDLELSISRSKLISSFELIERVLGRRRFEESSTDNEIPFID